MTPEQIAELEKGITAELGEALKRRSLIDEQIGVLRRDRKQVELVIAAGRAMLKFAATAKEAIRDTLPTPPQDGSVEVSTLAPPGGLVEGAPIHEPPLP